MQTPVNLKDPSIRPGVKGELIIDSNIINFGWLSC